MVLSRVSPAVRVRRVDGIKVTTNSVEGIQGVMKRTARPLGPFTGRSGVLHPGNVMFTDRVQASLFLCCLTLPLSLSS